MCVMFVCVCVQELYHESYDHVCVMFVCVQELYHESYDHVCVMFASIPNFWEYYEQNSVTRHGIECIRILNEIICDFDQVRPASGVIRGSIAAPTCRMSRSRCSR